MTDFRCVPGHRLAIEHAACTWHREHPWCEACEGFYGVDHGELCHTAEAIRLGLDKVQAMRTETHCACRFCEVARGAGRAVAELQFAGNRP